MRKLITTVVSISLLAGCSAVAKTAPATAPAATTPAPEVSAALNPRIIMLRWFVSDLERATKFYQEVFGMIPGQRMGDRVRIMLFPGGNMPGLILIQSPNEDRMNGSFVIQVADVAATLAKAQAGGATLMNTDFQQNVENMPARSSHFTDPDGNVVEVLQMGRPARK